MYGQKATSVGVSASASGRRRTADPNLHGRPSGAGIPCGKKYKGARGARREVPVQHNREHDEIELLVSQLHDSCIEKDAEMAVPPRYCPSNLDEVNPEWLRWQYPELPPTPEEDHTAVRFGGAAELAEPNEAMVEASESEAEDLGTLGEDEPIPISDEEEADEEEADEEEADEEEAGEERRTSASIVDPDG
ncbi:GH22167 [Drosophila grimshawi]|uniref:GH22167 n=1 Tax=Drosophila grimshawi TaxID=7222 RepID=B4K0E2_DROGR|nr:GH22167 [Drosophila grimshawi]